MNDTDNHPLQPPAAATQLLADMEADLERWSAGDDIDFDATHGAAARAAGAVPVLTALFRRWEGQALSAHLFALAFLWKDMPFTDWRALLLGIDDSTQAVYQFVWFGAAYLGLDVMTMVLDNPAVDGTAKDFVRLHFPSGAPPAGRAWERESLDNAGVDAVAMWQRLAAEGAPMKVQLDGLA